MFKVSYFYFATFTILQYIILATAWNLLGGYTGYVNFGVGAFFGLGAYASAALILYLKMNLILALIAGGLISAILGLALGYLTINLKGVYFAIATLALAVIVQMVIVNTPWLGGVGGFKFSGRIPFPFYSHYLEFLFALMLLLAFLSVTAVRLIEKSWIGKSFVAIRDCEEAAECMGMPAPAEALRHDAERVHDGGRGCTLSLLHHIHGALSVMGLDVLSTAWPCRWWAVRAPGWARSSGPC